MGLDFIRAKGERFVQKRDEARDEELNNEDLLTGIREDLVVAVFRCQLEDAFTTIEAGLPLILRHIGNSDMHVLSRNRKIGFVLPSEVPALIEAMRRNNHTSEFLSVLVVGAPGIDYTFTVKPKKRFAK